MNYHKIVEDVIDGYEKNPIDILGNNEVEGEYLYIKNQKDAYIRTINDIDNIFGETSTSFQ